MGGRDAAAAPATGEPGRRADPAPSPDEAARWLAELGIDPQRLAARGLRPHAQATRLVPADGDTAADGPEPGIPWRLVPAAAAAWQAMRAAARADGVALELVSAFRSVARQAELVRRRLQTGDGLDEVLSLIAPPGYSEHHTGRAVDIGTPGGPGLEASFEHTAAFAWLQRRAADFGFAMSYPRGNAQGYAYEPWHWCHHGDPSTEGATAAAAPGAATTWTVQVRYFAALREALGTAETVALPAGSRLADLRDALVARGGRHGELLARGRAVRCALDQTMADESAPLRDGAEVAFFPPVTGG
jgi:D-alanyl-D-alanine carboxypeptidase